MDEIRVGIVGSGFMGRTHAKGVEMTEGARLVAVAGGSRAPKLAKEFGAETLGSGKDLCRRKDIDAVVVATPHQNHTEYVLAALKAGKHVLVEKPMATTVEDCDRMMIEAMKLDLRLSVGYHQRFREVNIEAREIITIGKIGKVIDIQAFMVGGGGSKGHPWMHEAAAGGWLLGYGVHILDLLRWFLASDPMWLVSNSGTRAEDVPVENTTQMIMRFSTGERVAFWCTNIAPAGFPGVGCGIWLMGEKGCIMLDSFGKLQLAMKGGPWQTVAEQPRLQFAGDAMLAPSRMGAYAGLMDDFICACREGREPEVNATDGKAGVVIALAAYESGRTGKPVELWEWHHESDLDSQWKTERRAGRKPPRKKK